MQQSCQLCCLEGAPDVGTLPHSTVSTEAGAPNSLYRKGNRALPCLSAIGRLVVHERCAVPQGLSAGTLSQAAHLSPRLALGLHPYFTWHSRGAIRGEAFQLWQHLLPRLPSLS